METRTANTGRKGAATADDTAIDPKSGFRSGIGID
jgi:hypothetical protein